MATVYTHISPFQKRAINFFQQCLYRIGERGKIGSVLYELLLKQEFFHEFLASFAMTTTFEQRQYVRGQLTEVEVDLKVAYREASILESILAVLNPCPVCDGAGRLRHIIEQDHSEYSECPGCDGDGVAKARVCICSGPPMQPCGPRCGYPLTDEAAEQRE